MKLHLNNAEVDKLKVYYRIKNNCNNALKKAAIKSIKSTERTSFAISGS